MMDFLFTIVCYVLLLSIISTSLVVEIFNYFSRIFEYKERLKENRERVWKYFVGMGN